MAPMTDALDPGYSLDRVTSGEAIGLHAAVVGVGNVTLYVFSRW